jgi:hypothetical protein
MKSANVPVVKTRSRKPAKAPKKATSPAMPRESSKKDVVIDMLRRKGGATLEEIANATDWQKHTIRGFVSGTLTKKLGLTIESTKNADGERCYAIKK